MPPHILNNEEGVVPRISLRLSARVVAARQEPSSRQAVASVHNGRLASHRLAS